MPDVQVVVNGRSYLVSCEPGEEQHLANLAREIDLRAGALVESMGQVGDNRLLLIVGLLLADELAEARNELLRLKGTAPREERSQESELADVIERLAQRLEAIAARLEAA